MEEVKMEGTKINFTHRIAVKIVCYILFVVMAVIGVFGFFLTVYGIDEGWFTSHPSSFVESWSARSIAIDRSYEIMDSFKNDSIIPFTNLLYAIYDEDGNILSQNCDGETAYYLTETVRDSSTVKSSRPDGSIVYDVTTYQIRYWLRAPLVEGDRFYRTEQLYNMGLSYRYAIIPVTAAAIILLIASFIILLFGAGRKAGVDGVTLHWINRRVPLEIQLGVSIVAGCFSIMLFMESVNWYSWSWYGDLFWPILGLGGGVFLTALVGIQLCVCVAARLKSEGWWRNSLCYIVARPCWRFIKRAAAKLFRGLRRVYRGLWLMLIKLPLVWKAALIFCGISLMNIILTAAVLSAFYPGVPFIFLLLFDAAMLSGIVLMTLQLRRLQDAGEELSKGDLSQKIDTEGMFWDFKKHAENLNSISEGMSNAVNERMRSERFKTELITNVSHDIKTPLTSIINYVDLLKKEDLQNEKAAEYIEVLERQSAQLKKLTEDVLEASKASSGAITLNMERVDVSELLRQSVGEYSERLSQAGLTQVVTIPGNSLPVYADGKRLWRVFDNLLSNICKYSLYGTRAYITAEEKSSKVNITFRNISANELNIPADELMERFIRGDSSRSSEGSGLGLSIAKSLTDLMGGSLEPMTDGDLFKVTVSFPKMAESPLETSRVEVS